MLCVRDGECDGVCVMVCVCDSVCVQCDRGGRKKELIPASVSAVSLF